MEDSVRRFTATVAHDVTQDGPVAWRKHFADSPDFFDLRLDALTENLCIVAASYTEVIELRPAIEGFRGTQNGYFTGLAEKRSGQWQFRNVHWSLPVLAAKAP